VKEIRFVFCVHDHQPVGNFGHVFEKAFDTCYSPFFDLLSQFPAVRVGLHISGPLLEWIDSNRPGFFKMLGDLAAHGQIEMLSGGFYEPMLSVLPDRDARGQIVMLSEFIRRKVGQEPHGFWLTERVWEPDIPRLVDGTGMEYTLVDDSHFSYAGMDINELHGHYVTDKAGKTLSVFPINQRLRYMIPFKPVDETIEFLREKAMRDVDGLTYGDDGEKFGLWPGTAEWVLEKGWLKRFFQALTDNAEWLRMTLPGEFAAGHQPAGRVYLPVASYEEMMEWSLPAGSIPVYDELRSKLKSENLLERYRPFVRGGIWQNFLSKYPESNRIYRRMLRLSFDVEHEIARRRGKVPKVLEDARRELYRSQCNCAYWHGLFGGLYLNYLRHGLYSHLLNGSRILDEMRGGEWARSEIVDFDDDLANEALLESRGLRVVVRPHSGGAAEEISFKEKGFCLTNVLGRRREGYHEKIRAVAQAGGGEGSPQSIHDIVRVKENGLENLLDYDRFERLSFIDHVYPRGTDVWLIKGEKADDIGTLSTGAWQARRKDQSGYAGIRLSHEGSIRAEGILLPVQAEKSYTVHARNPVLSVAWKITNGSDGRIAALFAPELNLSLLAADDPARRLVIPGTPERLEPFNKVITAVGMSRFSLRDGWIAASFDVIMEPMAELWHFPVETVSQSEDGFERTYQGSAFILVFPLSLEPGETARFSVQLKMDAGGQPGF
jgi:alpha-amylase